MSFTDSYDDINQSVQGYCARTDAAFTGQMENFVSFAEDRIYNGVEGTTELGSEPLRVKEMFVTGVLSPVLNVGTGDYEYSVPDRCLGFRTIDTLGRIDIEYLAPDYFKTMKANSSGGSEMYYTVEGDKIKLIPGSEDTTIEVTYYKRPNRIRPGLQTHDVNDSHVLYANSPYGNLYLAAVMFEAMTFLQMDGAMAWLLRYKSAVSGANLTANAIRYGGGPSRIISELNLGTNLR